VCGSRFRLHTPQWQADFALASDGTCDKTNPRAHSLVMQELPVTARGLAYFLLRTARPFSAKPQAIILSAVESSVALHTWSRVAERRINGVPLLEKCHQMQRGEEQRERESEGSGTSV